MRNWAIAAGVILLFAYLLLPRATLQPSSPQSALPTFDDVVQKSGGKTLPTEQRHVSAAELATPPDCGALSVPEGGTLVMLSAYSGQAVSSVALGSQDFETSVVDIVVEPGDTPLYIVGLSFRPVIWRLSGAVDRVGHLLLTSEDPTPKGSRGRPLAGATGIERARVSFLAHADCLRWFKDAGTASAVLTQGRVRDHVGRMPEVVAAAEHPSRFLVPSGRAQAADPFSLWRRIREGFSPFRPNLRRDMTSIYPGGVAQIDPALVVASAEVEPYQVLPSYAGIQQLITEGALEDAGHDEFRIRRKLRLPAGLISGVWLLPPGVPEPDGKVNGMCLVSEATGHPVPGFNNSRSMC